MRKEAAILLAKTEYVIGKIVGKEGSSMPGAIARYVDPGFFRKIAEKVTTYAVTGTNGKTVTTKMIHEMLSAEDIPNITNWSGSNLENGAATPFLLNCDPSGNPRIRTAAIECDELWSRLLFDYMDPAVITVTNLLPDQLDRFESPEKLKEKIVTFLQASHAKICLNAEDPLCLAMAGELTGHEIFLYSEKDGIVMVNGASYPVTLHVPGNYNYKNAAAATAALFAANTLTEKGLKALSDFKLPFGRMETIQVHGRPISFNLAKNPSGVELTLDHIVSSGEKPMIVFGFNNKLLDGYDTTWIRRVPYEKYRNILSDVVCYGSIRKEMKEVISTYAERTEEIADKKELFRLIQTSEKPVFLILNFTCMEEIRGWPPGPLEI